MIKIIFESHSYSQVHPINGDHAGSQQFLKEAQGNVSRKEAEAAQRYRGLESQLGRERLN